MPKHAGPPVFHPDHPHNRNPYPFQTSPLAPRNPNIPLRQAANSRYAEDACMSESDMSSASPSPHADGRCFCGREVDRLDGGIYCSVGELRSYLLHRRKHSYRPSVCARSDAFSSLCYKPTPGPSYAPPSSYRQPSSIASSISSSLSRNPSTSSICTTTSTGSNITDPDWSGSHYRSVVRADIKREERKEERRRRRADASVVSTSSSGSRNVPDLVGGGGHSRNASVASSVTSMSSTWSGGMLSRNTSSASSASASSSRRGYGGGVHVDTVIMEDDDEEWLATDETQRSLHPLPQAYKRHIRRGSVHGKKKQQLGSFGMGKDMRDVLEEIIQMEKGFMVDDEDRDAPPGLFTATFEKPPRTPSPMSVDKRVSAIAAAPGAPSRGHRSALSHPHPALTFALQRPPSLVGLHQSSLSESHTALYLATASPVQSARRSASPHLKPRNSIAFSPDIAGPIIEKPLFSLPGARFDSPANLTPSGRRHNISPTAHHPAMDNWRFPSGTTSGGDMATPTRPVAFSQPAKRNAYETPVRPRPTINTNLAANERIEPQLLWPPPAPPLAPALFPSSPATSTPDFPSISSTHDGIPPNSGVRLGVLLGSMSPDEGMDVDDDDDASTAHGHGQGGTGTFLPVFLEAEGFRPNR